MTAQEVRDQARQLHAADDVARLYTGAPPTAALRRCARTPSMTTTAVDPAACRRRLLPGLAAGAGQERRQDIDAAFAAGALCLVRGPAVCRAGARGVAAVVVVRRLRAAFDHRQPPAGRHGRPVLRRCSTSSSATCGAWRRASRRTARPTMRWWRRPTSTAICNGIGTVAFVMGSLALAAGGVAVGLSRVNPELPRPQPGRGLGRLQPAVRRRGLDPDHRRHRVLGAVRIDPLLRSGADHRLPVRPRVEPADGAPRRSGRGRGQLRRGAAVRRHLDDHLHRDAGGRADRPAVGDLPVRIRLAPLSRHGQADHGDPGRRADRGLRLLRRPDGGARSCASSARASASRCPPRARSPRVR